MIHHLLQYQREQQRSRELSSEINWRSPAIESNHQTTLTDTRQSVYGSLSRPVFSISNYKHQVNGTPLAVVEQHLRDHPSLLKRNHYVLQHHYATARHFDLRLQLDGQTVSFAIPKGLSHWNLAGVKPETRLGVMTTLHPLGYSLFEGGRDGTTAMWDCGTYKIHPTKASLHRRKDYDVNGDTTDEDTPEDEREEDKFANQLFRTLFEPRPTRYGIVGCSNEFTSEEKAKPRVTRGFIIELTGARYQGLRLLMLRCHDDWTLGVTKGDIHKGRRTQFMIKVNSFKSEADLGDISVLSGRTMAEVAASGGGEQAGSRRGGPGHWQKQKMALDAHSISCHDVTSQDEPVNPWWEETESAGSRV